MSVLSLHVESTEFTNCRITSQFCSFLGGVLCSIRPAVHAYLLTESTVLVKEVKAVSDRCIPLNREKDHFNLL